MHRPVYLFGPFRLDTLARELQRDGKPVPLPVSAFDCLIYLVEHRQRPVGKDELIAAAWGRKEASDNLLAQNIVRLRRLMDSDSPCIRTVPRYGYRWVADTRVETHSSEPAFAEPGQSIPGDGGATAGKPPSSISRARHRAYLWATSIVVVCAIFLVGQWLWRTKEVALPANTLAPQALVVVLPAKVKAEGEWTWLRFGVMDIVANHLRAAGLRTVPSETVVALSRDGVFDDIDEKHSLDATWQVMPEVKYLDGTWRVHLQLRSVNGHMEGVEAASKDVLVATRQAAGALLSQMGVPGMTDNQTPSSLDDWLSKVAAARMQNEIDAAQAALDKVPRVWRDTPEVAYVQAILECDRGQRELCTQHLEGLLERLNKERGRDSVLRGRVLYTLGMRYAGAQQMDKGGGRCWMNRSVCWRLPRRTTNWPMHISTAPG
jgi:DNA-binding winged helix-turn-helix (wHTH) protein